MLRDLKTMLVMDGNIKEITKVEPDKKDKRGYSRDTDFYLRKTRCARCGKIFYRNAGMWAYKIYVNEGHTRSKSTTMIYFCTYNCWKPCIDAYEYRPTAKKSLFPGRSFTGAYLPPEVTEHTTAVTTARARRYRERLKEEQNNGNREEV